MHWEHLPMQLPDWLIKFIVIKIPWVTLDIE